MAKLISAKEAYEQSKQNEFEKIDLTPIKTAIELAIAKGETSVTVGCYLDNDVKKYLRDLGYGVTEKEEKFETLVLWNLN